MQKIKNCVCFRRLILRVKEPPRHSENIFAKKSYNTFIVAGVCFFTELPFLFLALHHSSITFSGDTCVEPPQLTTSLSQEKDVTFCRTVRLRRMLYDMRCCNTFFLKVPQFWDLKTTCLFKPKNLIWTKIKSLPDVKPPCYRVHQTRTHEKKRLILRQFWVQKIDSQKTVYLSMAYFRRLRVMEPPVIQRPFQPKNGIP